MRDHQLHELENGIRIVHKQVPNVQVAHLGIILDIGSRDEKAHQQGLAHFWEHMVFKGTQKRKAFHIINRLESVGGELNAYTTKEKICFYASVSQKYFANAVELLSDITFHSVFPEQQIEREKRVILEELFMYLDSPEDAIQDDFDDVIFKGHQLGKNILGDETSIKGYGKEDFLKFIQENLNTGRVIFSSVSSLPFEKVVKQVEKNLASIKAQRALVSRVAPPPYEANFTEIKRDLFQAHCAIGNRAYAIDDKRRVPFFLLNNIIGGPGMNSKLNMSLREKKGYVYGVESGFSSFTDTGIWGVFFATDPSQLAKSERLVLKELKNLREKPLGSMQLHQAKEQLIGQMIISEENNANLMLVLGKSLLDKGRVDTFEEVARQIREVTAAQIQEVAQDIFDEPQLSMLKYIPEARK